MSSPSSPSSYTAPRSLPFPPGSYTLLSIIDACDNTVLPSGPWSAVDCKHRRDVHTSASLAAKSSSTANANLDSALEDDDEEEVAVDPSSEFLVPFFLATPPSGSSGSAPSSAPASRRGSSTRASFTGFTPLPSLRSSSPTFSRPNADDFAPPPPPSAGSSRPIGFLRPAIVRALIEDNQRMLAMRQGPVWAFLPALELPQPPSRRASYSRSRPLSRRGSNAITPLTTTAPGTPGVGGGAPQQEILGSPKSGPGALRDALEGLSVDGAGGADLSGAGVYAVGFADWVNEEGEGARAEQMDRLVRGWKMEGRFLDQLGGQSLFLHF